VAVQPGIGQEPTGLSGFVLTDVILTAARRDRVPGLFGGSAVVLKEDLSTSALLRVGQGDLDGFYAYDTLTRAPLSPPVQGMDGDGAHCGRPFGTPEGNLW
jgi:hypothetical protein